MENQPPSEKDNKSCKIYFLLNDTKVYFTGDFDSGNLEKVQQLSPFTYRVSPGFDKIIQSTKKNFFYFRTFGFKKCRVKFQITRMYLLEHLIKSDESPSLYHPVSRRSLQGPFQKIKKNVSIYYNYNGEPQLSFSYEFENTQEVVQFAFTYPYTYQDNQKLLNQLSQRYNLHSKIYFHQQLLCKTKKGRNVDIITITNIQNCQKKITQGVTQSTTLQINKPVVLVSARVHPGQTTSSYCVEGVLKFLLNENDKRSAMLRKNFHFIIIPMINPDGVYQGMFRLGHNGFNLNRLYQNCNQKESIEIWSILQYINSLQRVDFFFDLHSHPSTKPFFIYGNSFQTFAQQVEAQLFGKFLQQNCPFFQSVQSIFTEKSMKSKQKYDNYGKQGCARVYYHKKFNLIHSYTVECGYLMPNKYEQTQKYYNHSSTPTDTNLQIQMGLFDNFQPQAYMLLGKCLLISILDLFSINPLPKTYFIDPNYTKTMRKELAQKIYFDNQKFKKLQLGNYKKIKEITQLISQKYYRPRFQHYGLQISHINTVKDHRQMKNEIKIGKIKKRILSKSNNFLNNLMSVTEHSDQGQKQENIFTGRTFNEITNSQNQLQITESIHFQQNIQKKIDMQTIHQRVLNSFSKYSKKSKIQIQNNSKRGIKDKNSINFKIYSKSKSNSQKLIALSTDNSIEKNTGESKNNIISKKYKEDQTLKKLIKYKLDTNTKEFIKFKRSSSSKQQEKPKNSMKRSNLQLPSLKNLSFVNSQIKLKTTQN